MNRKKSYIFTNKKHPLKGIMSSVLGIISLTSMGGAVYFTFLQKGYANISYGLTGVLALLFSLTGAVLGVLSRMEADKFHFFSYLGIVLNALSLAGIGFILYVGVYGL